MPETIVLAFSGGLDTSFCVPWLRENLNVDVVTVTVDTGGLDDAARERLAMRSAELGASRHHLVDGRSAYFEETLRFLIMGNVLRGHLYPLCVGAERTLQAHKVADVSTKLGATGIAHGSTAAGNDQVRFEVALRTLAPDLRIVAPIRDHGFTREFEINYLAKNGYDVSTERSAYSVNAGLWGCTIGGRETTDTVASIPEYAWQWTRGAFENPLEPKSIQVGFDQGVPVSLDDCRLEPVELIERLNGVAGTYGIGRGIHLGDTIFGLKGRVAFEAPAATVLLAAHRELEKLTLTAKQQRIKDLVAAQYGDWVHEAQFLEPACRDIEALLLHSQARVSGTVHVQLRPGSLFVTGVSSPHSLRNASRAVYGEEAGEWTAEDARGFARMLALPSMLHARATGG